VRAAVARIPTTPPGITRYTLREDLPEWLRVEEAAAAVGVSTSVVYGMCTRGEMPCKKFGRLLRIHVDGVRPPQTA
jgi:excisionase family DNA binding protein